MLDFILGDLENLLLINLKDCSSLAKLPRKMYKLKKVKTPILSGCSNIVKLEEDIAQMKSLTTLIAANIGVKQVPFSIVRSNNIGYIYPYVDMKDYHIIFFLLSFGLGCPQQ
jgi:hypothetical protein